MTKVTVISGFLGAGKTTLIKKLLEEAFKGEKVVLIENEFGEIGIDGGFMKEAGVVVSEMNSGCICCTLVGDFSEALGQVLSAYAPDRVIIEPSGVGKLSDVISAVKGVSDNMPLELTSSVTVVDGMKCKMYSKNFGEFYNNQVENAATIVMSRTQNMTEEKLKESVHLLRSKNSKASIITTPWEELRGDQILAAMEQEKSLAQELMEEYMKEEHHDHCDGDCGCEHHEHHSHGEEGECCCHHEHHHHHADEVFSDWGVETFEKYSKEELETILNALANTSSYGNVLRSKGMVQGKDKGWFYFDLVPNEYEIREGSPDVTGRICVIGTELHKDKIAQLFHI